MSSAYNDTILEFGQVSFSYERHRTFVEDLSFAVGTGEFIGLLGANGSGKSTILRLGSGILKQSSGRIDLWGKPVRSFGNRDRAKLLSYLPQVLDINMPFTVIELVGMGLYPYDIMPSLTVHEALDMVGLTEKAGSLITNLSGGERRRVYIAMTLLQGAGLLLLDEPLANLDIRYQIELIRLLKALRDRRGISVLMALHDINIAFQFDRILLVKEGRILAVGTPDEVMTGEMLREAFDVDVEVIKERAGGAYIRY
jgi:iron complex transport system ATP-binding protein